VFLGSSRSSSKRRKASRSPDAPLALLLAGERDLRLRSVPGWGVDAEVDVDVADLALGIFSLELG
jgi:hypothetical protein